METTVHQDIIRLIRERPLAWVLPHDQNFFPALLPMLAECDSKDAPVSLLGHVPKAQPLAAAFKKRQAHTVSVSWSSWLYFTRAGE